MVSCTQWNEMTLPQLVFWYRKYQVLLGKSMETYFNKQTKPFVIVSPAFSKKLKIKIENSVAQNIRLLCIFLIYKARKDLSLSYTICSLHSPSLYRFKLLPHFCTADSKIVRYDPHMSWKMTFWLQYQVVDFISFEQSSLNNAFVQTWSIIWLDKSWPQKVSNHHRLNIRFLISHMNFVVEHSGVIHNCKWWSLHTEPPSCVRTSCNKNFETFTRF